MANLQHRDIPEAQLHEPKGASTSTAGQILVSTGGASSWGSQNAPSPVGARYGDMITSDGTTAAYARPVWEDLLGQIVAKTSGPTAPTYGVLNGAIEGYSFAAADEASIMFHMPHDYALGTDVFLHFHWSHNGTAISGNMVTTFSATYSDGHGAGTFTNTINSSMTYNTVNIATTPRYVHRIDEVQISGPTATASRFASSIFLPDGILGVKVVTTTIPTITGGTPNEPFLLLCDLHYQKNMFGTKNKSPNFYV
jgi:hypothetical protein